MHLGDGFESAHQKKCKFEREVGSSLYRSGLGVWINNFVMPSDGTLIIYQSGFLKF